MKEEEQKKIERLLRDIFGVNVAMKFICKVTGLSEEEVLDLPEEEFQKYWNTFERAKNWKNN
jgi:hypothetical protein